MAQIDIRKAVREWNDEKERQALRDQESRGANRKIELSDELKKVEDALKTMQGPVERNPSVAIQKRKKAPNDASSAGTTEINTAVCGAAK